MVRQLVSFATRLAESHPIPWKLAWDMVHWCPFLLPHDRSYYALRHFIKAAPNGLFLDIGANDGISVLSFRKFDKDYRILSFEPNSMLEPALRRIRSKDRNFDYRMVGAGAAPARLKFFVPSYHGIVLHTSVSSHRDQVEQAIGACFGRSVADAVTITSVESDIVRLDDLNLDPTIVKIDAEGSDYEVLLGLDTTLTRRRPFVMVEIAWADNDRIADYLTTHGYDVLAYDGDSDRFTPVSNLRGSLDPGQRNFFAVPHEKKSLLPIDGATPAPRKAQ